MKHVKYIWFTVPLIFLIAFVCLLWMLQRDMNLYGYYTIANNSTLIDQFFHSNSTLKQLLGQSYPLFANYTRSIVHQNPFNDRDHFNNLTIRTNAHIHSNHIISTSNYSQQQSNKNIPNTMNDPYAEIFYYNKDLSNTPKTAEQINKIHEMWWNYDLFPMTPFTECEEKYLGYKQNAIQRPGDLTFNNSKSFKILCNNDEYMNDIRHSKIECYDTKWKGSTYICSFKNIYGYIDNENHLKFKAFCKTPINVQNQKIMKNIKNSYIKRGNNKYPLYIELIDDSKNKALNKMDGAKYSDMNNVWFYDNDMQCESHKGGDPEHIGNPWHCLGHLEYWYRISKIKNLSIYNYNMTLVMSQFTNYRFGAAVPIYHFYSPLFGNIINSDTVNRVVKKNGDTEKNKLYYIKELYIDERSAKGWGACTIWQDAPKKNFFVDKLCENTKELRRSHIYYDLKKDMMNYYELSDEYGDYNWVKEIKSIKGVNSWDIHGDLDGTMYDENDVNGAKLVVIATRYLNGKCRYRCLYNMREMKNAIVDILDNQYIVVYGNPGSLTFHGQYHLFKNTRIFIGVHGAAFLMASLFMLPQNLKFELTMRLGDKKGSEQNSEMVVRLFGGDKNIAYGKYYCGRCNAKKGLRPSNVSVNTVTQTFKMTMFEVYNITL